MIDIRILGLLLFLLILVFAFMFKNKPQPLAKLVCEEIERILRTKGFTDEDFDDLQITFEDQRETFKRYYVSIYRFDGLYSEVEVEGEPPIAVWYEVAARVVKGYLESIEEEANEDATIEKQTEES